MKKLLLNEISTLLRKLKDSGVIRFAFNNFPSSFDKLIKSIIEENFSEKEQKILLGNSNYIKYAHQTTTFLLLKQLINKIFTQVHSVMDESKKSALINFYAQKYFEANVQSPIKLEKILKHKSPKRAILKRKAFYLIFFNLYRDMVHYLFDKSVFLKKIFPYLKISKPQNIETEFQLEKENQDLEKIINFISSIFENEKFPFNLYEMILSGLDVFESLYINNQALAFKKINQYRKNPDLFYNDFLDWLNKKYQTNSPVLTQIYSKIINFIIKKSKQNKIHDSLINLLEYRFRIIQHSVGSVYLKGKGKSMAKSELRKNQEKVEEYYKLDREERERVKSIVNKEFNLFSVLLKQDVEKLITLGLIYKDFNDNFINKYKSVLILVLKKLLNEIQK